MTVNQLSEAMDDEVVINGCSYVNDDTFDVVCHTTVGDFRKLREGSLKWFAYATVVDESLGILNGEIYFDIEGVWTEEDRKMTREQVLEQAKTMVCGQREHDYGKPEDNFGRIADLWTAYLGEPIDSVDVAMCMALLKIARIKGGGTDDCFIDLAGYAACGGELN